MFSQRGWGEPRRGFWGAQGLCCISLYHATLETSPQVALGDTEVQGQGQMCCVLRLGGPAWERAAALEKGSSRQDCIQALSLCLEERTSELRSWPYPGFWKIGGSKRGYHGALPPEVRAILSWRLARDRVQASMTVLLTRTLFPQDQPWGTLGARSAWGSPAALSFTHLFTHSSIHSTPTEHHSVPGTRGIRNHRHNRLCPQAVQILGRSQTVVAQGREEARN